MRSLAAVQIACALALSGVAVADEPEAGLDLDALSFEQLLDVRIVSASNASERWGEAPATVIVLTADDIAARGYTDLGQILDDLPGLGVVRPYGATYFKTYWRGYRNTIGDPFLVLVDGLELNHLYFNTADVLVTFPLAAIDRVEVVYGPASSVYGANAFMGVINVITRKDGDGVSGFVAAGERETRIADFRYGRRGDGWWMSLSGRVDDGDLADGANELYEYTRDRYVDHPAVWGGFLADPDLAGGGFSSPHRHRAFDLRLGTDHLELGVARYDLESGYGYEYAADRAQEDGVWSRPDLSVHLRGRWSIGESVEASTLLRYRESDVDEGSWWVESVPVEPSDGGSGRAILFSYWSADSSSWTVRQDFEVTVNDRFSFNAGVEAERKDLQKAYDISYGPPVPVEDADPATYPFPPREPADPIPDNRIDTTDVGGYVQTRYRLSDDQILHFGVRQDHNSEYGGATTVRAGWVAKAGRWGTKILYGEAYQEPNPRVLYGGWTGSGSDPNLNPERSHTIEGTISFTTATASALATVFHVLNEDTIVNTTSGARNLGDRKVTGLELQLQGRGTIAGVGEVHGWVYGSHLFKADERKLDPAGGAHGSGPIGDVVDDQVIAGLRADLGARAALSLRGRWIGDRRTIETNPVREVPAYTTVDAALTVRHVGHRRVSAVVTVTNLFDEAYVHPGVREADAGVEPGFVDAAGRWHGSAGYFSSLLPQPGRAVVVILRVAPR